MHAPRKFALNIKHARIHAWTLRAQHWLDSTLLSPRYLLRLPLTQHNPRCIVRSLISQCCNGQTNVENFIEEPGAHDIPVKVRRIVLPLQQR